MALHLSREHFELIKAYGEQAFPNEGCGFLIGKEEERCRAVHALLPATNAHEQSEQYRRFLITPQTYLEAEKEARKRDLEIIGFYHSHPNAPARPSAYDLEHAWPWYSYVIVSVKEGRAAELTSWRLLDTRLGFDEETVTIDRKESAA